MSKVAAGAPPKLVVPPNSIEIQKTLQETLAVLPGVQAIFITDKDGVILVSAGEELRSRQVLIASQLSTADQISKLLIGAHSSSVFTYDSYQIVVLNAPPYLTFIVATPLANTGVLIRLKDKLEPLFQQAEIVMEYVTAKAEYNNL